MFVVSRKGDIFMSIEINIEDLQELVEERSPSLTVGGVRLRNMALLDADEFDRYEKIRSVLSA